MAKTRIIAVNITPKTEPNGDGIWLRFIVSTLEYERCHGWPEKCAYLQRHIETAPVGYGTWKDYLVIGAADV